MGIVSYEFVWTVENAKRMREAWSPRAQIFVSYSLGVDHLFMVLYSSSIALGCVMIGKGAELAIDMAALQFLAGILDFLEGLFLYAILIQVDMDNLDARIPMGATVCASMKFSFVLIGFIYFFGMLLMHRSVPGAVKRD